MKTMMIDKPTNFTEDQKNEFEALVKLGRQVDIKGLGSRLNHSQLLGFYYVENQLTSIVAIKRPDFGYRNRVFQKSHVSERSDEFSLELGWAYTVNEYRGKGIGGELAQAILEKAPRINIFATTKTDNYRMQRILTKNGFISIGKPYAGNDNHKLILLIRNVK